MTSAERQFVRRWAWCTVTSAGALVAPAALNALLLVHPAALTLEHATAALSGCLAASICAVPQLYARLFAGNDH